MEKTNPRKSNEYLMKVSVLILLLLFCCESDGKSFIVQSYNIDNNSLCSIIDSIEIMNPGSVYSLVFSNQDDCVFMTVLHVKDENDIIDLIEEYADYYHIIGYIAGHENFYIFKHCNVEKYIVRNFISATEESKKLERKAPEVNSIMFIYQENILYKYNSNNNTFYKITKGELLTE